MLVRTIEDLRVKWCREVQADYFKVYTMYCCEEHFDLEEDLKNYYQYKLMQDEPVFKSMAKLQNMDLLNSPKANAECSELYTLLQKEKTSERNRKFEDHIVEAVACSV